MSIGMQNEIRRPICFCADGNYARFVVPAIESIERADPEGKYEYHVISDMEMSAEIISALKVFISLDRLSWHIIDPGRYSALREVHHFTRAMYYRLSIPDVIDADIVLYLDCDVLVRKPLAYLFDLDLTGYYIAAVANPFFTRDLVSSEDYFNSGVMVVNCRKWKSEGVAARAIKMIAEYGDRLDMPDQDALNMVFGGGWYRLAFKYNSQMSCFLRLGEGEVPADMICDPIIVHFSSSNKQWHRSCPLIFVKEYKSLSSAFFVAKRNTIFDVLIRVVKGGYFKWVKKNPFFSPW
ncbi:glycosyltransferase family 8 protein [Stutzerimonas tarimensis]|uniref:Glycosyltransferase family 8 protein n=1 Tax=Stutzerimonas tarimensis TaxID=1507735 RepID=A0ABV7T5S8_9GAMM